MQNEADPPKAMDGRRRIWWALPLTAAVFVLGMVGPRLGRLETATQSGGALALCLPVVVWAGWPFIVRSAQSMVRRIKSLRGARAVAQA